MAVQNAGLGKGPDGSRVDQTSGDMARGGAAKHPQTTFKNSWGMKDMTSLSGISPANPGTGPDASDANPLYPSPVQSFSRASLTCSRSIPVRRLTATAMVLTPRSAAG